MFSLRSLLVLVVCYAVIPRLTFLPQSVHTLLIVFGPFLLPRVLDWVAMARATTSHVPVRAVPRRVRHVLHLLLLSAGVWLALSFARFAPDNIFMQTRSHMRTETSVLFARLRHLRPLSAADEALRAKFNFTRNKLLYLAYGPDTLLKCSWCAHGSGNDQLHYFLYSLPGIMAPHMVQLGTLGLATSSLVGAEGSRFRGLVTMAGLAVLATECWYMFLYPLQDNKRAFTMPQLDSAFWRVRFIRHVGFAAVDLGLALVLWASSTNRWLVKPVSMAERLETATKQCEDTLNKLRALGLLTNSVNRDAGLRGVREQYWRTEGQVMAETVEDAAVTEQINAVIGKMDLSALQAQAGEVADGILRGIDGLGASQIV